MDVGALTLGVGIRVLKLIGDLGVIVKYLYLRAIGIYLEMVEGI